MKEESVFLRMFHKEFSLVLCGDLSEWDGGDETEVQKGGDICIHITELGFPGSSAGKESACIAGETPAQLLGWKVLLENDRLPSPVFLGFAVSFLRSVKNLPAMWETWIRPVGWEDPLEKGKATHFNILAWRIPMDGGALWSTVHRVTKSQT